MQEAGSRLAPDSETYSRDRLQVTGGRMQAAGSRLAPDSETYSRNRLQVTGGRMQAAGRLEDAAATIIFF